MNEFLSLLSIVLLLFSFCSGCIQGHKADLQSRDHAQHDYHIVFPAVLLISIYNSQL